jgi:NAD(P)-dependent dehydrogenase (short-subunit alcohol dehydrogenase family)
MFTPSSLPSLTGKIFIVTGGNTGIGYATCLNVVAKGGRVYMGARSSSKADAAIAKIKEAHPNADLHGLIMDNASLNTVVKAAKNFISKESQLHGLILNAGIMAVPYALTSDGFESQMQVNYLAHWILTYYLLPILQSTARKEGPGSVRIVSVSSKGHQKSSFGVTKILYGTTEIEKFWDFG